MSRRKTESTKTARKGTSRKTTSKRREIPPLDLDAIRSGNLVIYGDPIRQAVARGDINEMRKLAVIARRWMRDVQGALNKLETAINRLEG